MPPPRHGDIAATWTASPRTREPFWHTVPRTSVLSGLFGRASPHLGRTGRAPAETRALVIGQTNAPKAPPTPVLRQFRLGFPQPQWVDCLKRYFSDQMSRSTPYRNGQLHAAATGASAPRAFPRGRVMPQQRTASGCPVNQCEFWDADHVVISQRSTATAALGIRRGAANSFDSRDDDQLTNHAP